MSLYAESGETSDLEEIEREFYKIPEGAEYIRTPFYYIVRKGGAIWLIER
jgi:hypothetical protein